MLSGHLHSLHLSCEAQGFLKNVLLFLYPFSTLLVLKIEKSGRKKKTQRALLLKTPTAVKTY